MLTQPFVGHPILWPWCFLFGHSKYASLNACGRCGMTGLACFLWPSAMVQAEICEIFGHKMDDPSRDACARCGITALGLASGRRRLAIRWCGWSWRLIDLRRDACEWCGKPAFGRTLDERALCSPCGLDYGLRTGPGAIDRWRLGPVEFRWKLVPDRRRACRKP